MQHLPTSALAAVVIAAVIGLFVVTDLRRIFRVQQWEFWLSMACFAGVVTFGVIPGIGIAVVLAVLEFLWDGWRPYYTVLGQVEGIRGFHDIKRHPDARQIPGLLLFRWDAPLFFANAELFQQCLLQALEKAPAPVRRVVIAAEPVTSIDVTSADMLGDWNGCWLKPASNCISRRSRGRSRTSCGASGYCTTISQGTFNQRLARPSKPT